MMALANEPAGDVFPGPDVAGLEAGRYYDERGPNDHCFIEGPDGRWHVFGITRPRIDLDNIHAGEQPIRTRVLLFLRLSWLEAWVGTVYGVLRLPRRGAMVSSRFIR